MNIKNTGCIIRLLAGLIGSLFFVNSLKAQWVEQSITLSPGWNAVFLEVQPEPDDCDSVFNGYAIDSVWAPTRNDLSAQFVEDANNLIPEMAAWSTYYPTTHKNRPLRNLFRLQGGRCYVINNPGAASILWRVTGRPVMPRSDWIPNVQNFVGIYVGSSPTMTLREYFQGSPNHSGQVIRILNSTGRWVSVSDTTLVERGRAYWINSAGASSYAGPLRIALDQSRGIDFSDVLVESRIVIRNDSPLTRNITLSKVDSLPRPTGASTSPQVLGPVALSWWSFTVDNLANGQAQWQPLTQLTATLSTGQEASFRIAVRRADMNATSDGAFQSLLQLVDQTGYRSLIPVVAKVPRSSVVTSLRGRAQLAADTITSKRAGLWVGMVVVSNVSWVGAMSPNVVTPNPLFVFQDRTTPRPTPSEFQFRIILHCDSRENVRLLNGVTEMWKPGTTQADPLNPGMLIPNLPGRFVLYTDGVSLPADLKGVVQNEGKYIGRRISAPVFSFPSPVLMTSVGAFGEGANSCVLTVDYDDRLNPFKHRYHPDHDNLGARYELEPKLAAGKESWTIIRRLQFEFAPSDETPAKNPAWGDRQIGGRFREELSGVHKESIFMSGSFRLQKISDVTDLNDGQL